MASIRLSIRDIHSKILRFQNMCTDLHFKTRQSYIFMTDASQVGKYPVPKAIASSSPWLDIVSRLGSSGTVVISSSPNTAKSLASM